MQTHPVSPEGGFLVKKLIKAAATGLGLDISVAPERRGPSGTPCSWSFLLSPPIFLASFRVHLGAGWITDGRKRVLQEKDSQKIASMKSSVSWGPGFPVPHAAHLAAGLALPLRDIQSLSRRPPQRRPRRNTGRAGRRGGGHLRKHPPSPGERGVRAVAPATASARPRSRSSRSGRLPDVPRYELQADGARTPTRLTPRPPGPGCRSVMIAWATGGSHRGALNTGGSGRRRDRPAGSAHGTTLRRRPGAASAATLSPRRVPGPVGEYSSNTAERDGDQREAGRLPPPGRR